MTRIVLATESKQRKVLFNTFGLAFECDAANIDETAEPNESPLTYTKRIALTKLNLVAARHSGALVLAADTIVELDGSILGKPNNEAHAKQLLLSLSDKEHRVLTSIALKHQQKCYQLSVSTKVRLKKLSCKEIDRYILSKEPFGKAGAYAIQGTAAQFVQHLEGSYSNVVGLPLYETAMLFQSLGFDTL